MELITINKEEFILLRDLINDQCGILLGDEKDYLIEHRLSDLARENGCVSFNEFYFKAKNQPESGLRDKIVDAMTTNETLWFRDAQPFNILDMHILPDVVEKARQQSPEKIRIWSAACSTGQEPYSLAMVLLNYCKKKTDLNPDMFEILATDISPSALYLAINGKYTQIAINRGLPDPYKNQFFKKDGNVFSIDDKVKKIVTFKKFNLQNDFSLLGRFDIILCRYVTIYFSEALKREIYYKMSQILHPWGYLLLGATEAIGKYSTQYQQHRVEKTTYYQLRRSR